MDFQKKKNFIVDFVYYSLWLMIIYFVYKAIALYLFPFFIGLIIAYLVQKPATIVGDKTKIDKKIYAAVFSVLFYLIFFALLFLIIWIFYLQVHKFSVKITNDLNMIDALTNNFNNLIDKLSRYSNYSISFKDIFVNSLNQIINKTSVFLTGVFTSFVKKIPSFAISFIITFVATFFLSKDFDRFYMFLKGIISENFLRKIVDIKNIALKNMKSIGLGYFLIFLITFTELILGFFVLDIPNLFMLAFIISFIDMLPVLGTGIILIPWGIIEIFLYNFNRGIGLVILYFIIVIVKNFTEPKVIGEQTGINPLFTLIFIFLGLKIGGIIGMITLPFVLTVCFNYFRQKYNFHEEKI